MNEQPDGPSLDVAGLDRWLPLDVEVSPAELATWIARQFGGRRPDAKTRAIAEALAQLVENTRGRAEREDAADLLVIAMWVLLSEPRTLLPEGLATMRLMRLPVDDPAAADPLYVVAQIAGGAELWDTPPLLRIETASGAATATRIRSMVDGTPEATSLGDAPRREVHEQQVVIWMRHEQGFAAFLSTYHEDLSEGDRMAPELHQLAEGVGGL